MTTLRGASSWYVTSGLGLVGLDVAGAIVRQGVALDRRLVRSELMPLLELKGTLAQLTQLDELFARD